MFGRKNKNQPEQGSAARRSPNRGQPLNPTFSYYTARTPDAGVRRTDQRIDTVKDTSASPRRAFMSRLPFWVLLAIVLVCAVKLLALGTDPKVVILGNNATSSTYMQPATTYETAAQKLLASSITNRTKLTVNLNGTANALERQFPELQAVSVTLPLIGNRPIVYVQAAQPSVILQSGHGNFALNKSGLVLARAATVPSGVPLVVDQTGVAPRPGQHFLAGSTISFMETVAYQLTAAKIPIATYVLPAHSPYEIDIRLEGKPFVVRCNLQSDALVQSGAVIATLEHLGATTPGSYVDVRVPDRVYYK